MVRSLILLTNLIFTVVGAFLGARLLLKLFAANPASDFVAWIYGTTNPLIAPFAGAFPAAAIEGGMVLEFTTLFALLVYGFVAYLVIELLRYISASVEGFHRDHEAKRATHHEAGVEDTDRLTTERHVHHHL